jgi:formate dehydrogenase subunit gamma
MSDRRIPRLARAERVSHWLYALFFLAALTSGLLMWIPETRVWMSGARHTVSEYHGLAGWLMVVLPVLLLLILNRRRLAEDIREVDLWDEDDRHWLWAALRGGTLRSKEMPPQGRLNAGQKINTILVAAMAMGFALTGSLLLARAQLPPWLVSRALWLHGFLAIAAMALFVGHLGHVVLTRHGWSYLRAMVYGSLDQETARQRHAKWWLEVQKEEDPPSR